jgi:thiol-disulfide isomerase/thioredoxin
VAEVPGFLAAAGLSAGRETLMRALSGWRGGFCGPAIDANVASKRCTTSDPQSPGAGRLRGPRLSGAGAAVATLLAAVLVLTACGTGHDAVNGTSAGQFRFVSATSQGHVIPANDRKPAGDLRGTLIAGGNYELSQHRGRVVLINFWASWCAPCVLESPMLDTIYQQMTGSGIDFVGIDIKDGQQAAQSFITDKQMTYPMVYDEPAKTALQLGIPASGLPVTALIDRSGRVAAVYIGPVQQADIQPALQQLAAEAA